MKFELLERQPLEPLDERLLVPGLNHVFPVGKALGQFALVEEQVALFDCFELSSAHQWKSLLFTLRVSIWTSGT